MREFGLSEYAARAYLALLDLGLTEARDVSTLSRVPTSKIYHILEQLHDKGLVEIMPEYPKKYGPIPFEEYVDKLRLQHESAARALRRDRDDLARLFSVSGQLDLRDRGGFSVVRGRQNVVAKVTELLGSAEQCVFFKGTPGSPSRKAQYVPSARAAHARGVRTRLLFPAPARVPEAYEQLAEHAEVRLFDPDGDRPGLGVGLLVADDTSAFLVNYIPDDGHLYRGQDVAMYTDQEAMVDALLELAEARWATAKPL